MPIAERLVNSLQAFNAKERNHLMRFALLGETDPTPPLRETGWVHQNFLDTLKNALTAAAGSGAQPEIRFSGEPVCVYAAMDYHLDWLHAALWCTNNRWPGHAEGESPPVLRFAGASGTEGLLNPEAQHDVMGNLEDVDLLLVIKDRLMTYLVMIEAKGEASFSRSQLASKLARLRLILDGDHVPPKEELTFAFVLMAPAEKLKLGGTKTYAELARYPKPAKEATFRELTNPPKRLGSAIVRMPMSNYPKTLNLVTRCHSDSSAPDDARYKYWKIGKR